jgi:predicted RNA-binding protein with RPS1 domain
MLHISEVSHARVTNMDAMFAMGKKMKVSLNKFMSGICGYNYQFHTYSH